MLNACSKYWPSSISQVIHDESHAFAGVAPLVGLMWQRVLLSQIMAMDETPVKELSGVGAARTGYLWAGVGDAQHPYDCFFVESLQKWLEDEQLRQLPKSKLRGAINYMLNRWDSFTRFLESGAIPLDNNAAERAVKFPILGRKAWLFVGNHQAGETAATLFTLTKTCNRHRIDPFAYLQDVFARLPTMTPEELPALLPDRWILEHPEHLIDQRVQEALDRAQRKREQRAERRQARGAA